MHITLRIAMPTLALAIVLSCGPSTGGAIDDTGPPTEGDTDVDSDSDDDTASPLSDVAWFTLQGYLQVTGGEAVAGGSRIEVQFHPSEAESNDGGIEPCSVLPGILGLTTTTASDPTVTLYGWWAASLADPDDDACITQLPANLHLGIGPVEPALFPAMEAQGYDPQAGTLYGLYVQYGSAPTPPIWVFGVTGTTDNFAGTAPAAGPPLPNGDYTLVSLHLLPFDAR